MNRTDVLAICRRFEAYGRSPKLTLHGDDSIVASLRDVLLAMAKVGVSPLELADTLDRTLPPMPRQATRESAIEQAAKENRG